MNLNEGTCWKQRQDVTFCLCISYRYLEDLSRSAYFNSSDVCVFLPFLTPAKEQSLTSFVEVARADSNSQGLSVETAIWRLRTSEVSPV